MAHLTEELQVVTRERENLQERYSQQFIIMNKRLEDMKKEKELKIMNLNHHMKSQLEHNQKELSQIETHNNHIMKGMKVVVDSINKNEFLNHIQHDITDTSKINAMKEAGIQEGERKMKARYEKQIQEQEKEKQALQKQYADLLAKKDEEFENIKRKYEEVMKHRDKETEKAKTEIVKIYTSILRQSEVIEGIEAGLYSNGMVTQNVPNKPNLPSPNDFPMLFATLKEKKGVLLNERGQTYKKIKTNLLETGKEIDQMTDDEVMFHIQRMQETSLELKKMIEQKRKYEKEKQRENSNEKLYYKLSYQNTPLFSTLGTNRPSTQMYKHRGSTGNFTSLQKSSLIPQQFFASRKSKNSNRASSIQSTRSISNTKQFT